MAGEKIKQIGLVELGAFGVGERTNSLYFDGQRVHTDAVVSLTSGQTRFAILVGVATIIAALATTAYSFVYIYDTLFRAKPVTTLSAPAGPTKSAS